MPRFSDDLIARWATVASTADRARGVVVTDGRSVGIVAEVSTEALLADRIGIPEGAFPVDVQTLRQLRWAVPELERARDIDVAIRQGHRKLRRWRGRDISADVDGQLTCDRIEWALRFCSGTAGVTAPPGVLADVGVDLPPAVRARIPAFQAPVIEQIVRVADRLVRVSGAAVARRWVDSARAVYLRGDEAIVSIEAVVAASARGQRVPGAVIDSRVRLLPEDRKEWHRLRTAVDQREVVVAVAERIKPACGARDVIDVLLATPNSDWSISAAGYRFVGDAAVLLRIADPTWIAEVVPHLPDWLESELPLRGEVLASVPARVALRLVERRVWLSAGRISHDALIRLVELLDATPAPGSRNAWPTFPRRCAQHSWPTCNANAPPAYPKRSAASPPDWLISADTSPPSTPT